eukprot:g3678.t1
MATVYTTSTFANAVPGTSFAKPLTRVVSHVSVAALDGQYSPQRGPTSSSAPCTGLELLQKQRASACESKAQADQHPPSASAARDDELLGLIVSSALCAQTSELAQQQEEPFPHGRWADGMNDL